MSKIPCSSSLPPGRLLPKTRPHQTGQFLGLRIPCHIPLPGLLLPSTIPSLTQACNMSLPVAPTQAHISAVRRGVLPCCCKPNHHPQHP